MAKAQTDCIVEDLITKTKRGNKCENRDTGSEQEETKKKKLDQTGRERRREDR